MFTNCFVNNLWNSDKNHEFVSVCFNEFTLKARNDTANHVYPIISFSFSLALFKNGSLR